MAEQDYTSSGPTVDQMREDSRIALALKLLYTFAGILTVTIIIASVLLWYEKLSFDNGITLILAIMSPFSGLLGSAITFYFSSKSDG